MSSINKVILIGNLGSDPELRTTGSGTPVCNLSIATSRTYKDRDGNRQEKTEWHKVVCWMQAAEFAGRYLTKGAKVYVEGRLETRSWDDQATGTKKYMTEVVCDVLQSLSPKQDGGQRQESTGGGYGAPKPRPERAPEPKSPVQGGFGDDDPDGIPF